MYYINYHTGAGNEKAETLDEAMKIADEGCAYTQQPVSIEKDDVEIMRRPWWDCLSGLEDAENPIQFGDFGFYGDWEDID